MLLFSGESPEATPLANGIRRLFGRGTAMVDYIGPSNWLDADFREFRNKPPSRTPVNVADSTELTLAVVLFDQHLQASEDLLTWLNELAGIKGVQIIPIDLIGRWDQLCHWPDLVDIPTLTNSTGLGEPAERPVRLALIILAQIRNMLSELLDNPRELCLFISHAKRDGLPIAGNLRDTITGLPGMKRFYDVENIGLGFKWREKLSQTVADSVLIALRSNNFEDRWRCRQEIHWADDFAVPGLVVDLRTLLAR
ncbi:MAG: hypothetical protein AAF492_32140, partial [Verrucomicrobiota bacterium]